VFKNENNCMKTSRSQNNKQSKQGHMNRAKPDIRDDMDAREGKETNPNNAGNTWKPVNANKPVKKKKKRD
jgi:hypothetical protein